MIGSYANRVVDSSSGGAIRFPVDLNTLPIGGGTAAQAGETWNFQCWYRDANPGPTSNLTDALSVMVR